jgi:hypothetical protein
VNFAFSSQLILLYVTLKKRIHTYIGFKKGEMLFKRKSENLPRVVFKKYLFYVICLLEECGSNRHSSSLNLSGVIKLYPIRFVSDESCGCWISLCC